MKYRSATVMSPAAYLPMMLSRAERTQTKGPEKHFASLSLIIRILITKNMY